MTESREEAAGRAGRATIKALPAPLHHPRPYEGTPREKDFSIALKFVDDDLSPHRISCIIAMAVKSLSIFNLWILKEGEAMAMQKHKPRTRMMIDIIPELRRPIKIEGAHKHISARRYITRILLQ